jgi:hypothetical protein
MSIQQPPSQTARDEPAHTPLPGELTHTTAPVPTRKTIRQRTSLPIQAYRFAAVTWKMLKIIGRSHEH